ncbi:hypothetical protein AGLY_010055, partial [Aphis glycines]
MFIITNIWYLYLAKDVIRLECVKNKFISHAAYLLKIEHLHHDYSLIHHKFTISVLNGSVDVPKILSNIKLRIASHSTRSHNLFYIFLYSTSYSFRSSLFTFIIINFRDVGPLETVQFFKIVLTNKRKTIMYILSSRCLTFMRFRLYMNYKLKFVISDFNSIFCNLINVYFTQKNTQLLKKFCT